MAEKELQRTESVARRGAARKSSWGPPRVASFLLGLPPHQPHPLKKALKNYRQRLHRHHLQFIEWQEHLSHRPDPNAMPPGAAEALKEAEASIGNRLLKTQPDYVAPPGHNTQLRVCLNRKEIYDNKREFNTKVLELRDHKVRLVARMQHIGERLAEIRAEIPSNRVKSPPHVPLLDDDLEFPEKHLVINPEPIQTTVRTATGKKAAPERRKSTLYPQPRTRQPRVPGFVPLTESRPLAASWELLKPRPDQEFSTLEIEIRERRITRHLYEQDMLLADAEVSVQQFDARLRQLQRERIRVQERNQLLELHLYQLHREMNVLNRFEAHEDRLAERVYVKLMQVRGVQDQILECEHRIEEHQVEKEQLDLTCQELQRQFKRLVQDNKFADFLRRIFKKKYRPPRDRDEDESSESESSSSSSEEEDEGSVDSRDIGPIRLDPNVCPEGCDQEVYDKTYDLRNTRHRHEQQMMEQDRMVEILTKDIDSHNKVKQKLSLQLVTRKNELREFMMEKQSCLNDVEQVVVLRYDQIRASALRGCTGPAGLTHTVLFPERMLARLRKRVLELQDEIKQQKQRQKVNRTHLFRMNVDLREMEAKARELHAKMRDVLTRKLGKPRKVDKTLDDLLKQMARRHKFASTLGTTPQMMVQLRKWQERHGELEKKYLQLLNHYSDRLRLAAALQADVVPQKPMKDPSLMTGGYKPQEYQRDVVRLRIIRSQQQQQIQMLREEIQNLSVKPLSHVSHPEPYSPPESENSQMNLSLVPCVTRQHRRKYFPVTPLGSQQTLHDVNVMKLLYDCLDAMRVTRDDSDELLQDLTTELPGIISGNKSRFEVVDALVRKWVVKYGGDPSQYKKQTRAFDALAALVDRLIREQVEAMENTPEDTQGVMESLEQALKGVSGAEQHLYQRLGPALAALFHTAESSDLDTPETMTSLVNSLVDEQHPLTQEAIDEIDLLVVMGDIKDCGVQVPDEELLHIIKQAIDCLSAQLIGVDETAKLDKEVQEAMARATEKMPR